jgi:hypothetical protein
MAGPAFNAPPVAVGVIALLAAVVPLLGLKPLKLVWIECGMLTGPGPVSIVLKTDKGIVGEGMTEVIVSVWGGLRKVSVTTVVIPLVGTENVLPDFVPLNVPKIRLARSGEQSKVFTCGRSRFPRCGLWSCSR